MKRPSKHADDSIEELAVEDLEDREDTATKVPRPLGSVQELDSDLLEDADHDDADATVVGSLAEVHAEDHEPTVDENPHARAREANVIIDDHDPDATDADPTLIGSLDPQEEHDEAEPTILGSLVETDLRTEKIKPIIRKKSEPPPLKKSDRPKKESEPPEPATNKIAPRPSLVAEQKIEALLSRLEETALSREKSRLLKQIAAVFKDELGDEAQAFDALLEAFKVHPEDRDTKAKLETLGRKLGRVGEISSAMGLGSGEFQGLRALEADLRRQKKFTELEEVLEKEIEAAPDRDAKIDALLRHAELLEHQLVKPKQAIAKFEAVIALQSTNEPAQDGVARCLVSLRAWDELVTAIESRIKITAKASSKTKLLLELAEVHEAKRGDANAAMEALLRAEKGDKRNKRVLYELARMSEKKGDVPAAAAYRGELAELTDEPEKKAQIHAAIGEMLSQDDRDPTAARIHFEKAVNFDPKLLSAWEALQTHSERAGNTQRAAYALEMRAENTESPRMKALLYAELAEMRELQLEDPNGAVSAYEKALAFDPTLERAARMVLDVYVKRKDWTKAAPACELLVHAATRDGDADRAFQLFLLGAKIAEESGHPERAVLAALAAYELKPTSPDARSGLVEAMHAARAFPQELGRAKPTLDKIIKDANKLDPSTMVLLADILIALGDAQGAAHLLGRAAERDPRHAGALSRLADAHVASGNWREAALRKRELATSVKSADEKYKLYVEAGEILAHQAKDFEGAAESFEDARKQKPQDHWILHTQLWLYGQMEAWGKMASTLRAIASVEKDPVVRAKGIFAMAQLVRDKCDDPRWAAELFDEVLQIDATRLDAFERIVRILTELKDWEALEKAYRAMVERLKDSGDVNLKHAICNQLGLIYRDRLGDAKRALAAFQAALKLKPDSAQDRKILTELYVVVDDLPKALEVAREGVTLNPERAEPIQEMYEIFLRQGAIDKAWCAVDVLAQQKTLNEEQRRFHEGHPPLATREVPGTLNGAAWDTHLIHRELDPTLTAIFMRITPAVVRARLGATANRPAEDVLGPKLDAEKGDLARLVLRAFLDAGEILGIAPPTLHVRAKMSTPFMSVAWITPAVVVSLDQLAGLPRAALAYLAGKVIAQNREEIVARALFPSVSELKALAATGVRLGSLVEAGTITDQNDAVLLSAMTHDAIVGLRAYSRKLNDNGGATLDVKRWAELAELSAARAGLLIAGSAAAAKRANAVEARSPADLPHKEWWAELALFATSDTYADLRQAIGVDHNSRKKNPNGRVR